MSEYELNGEEKALVTWLVEANRNGQLENAFRYCGCQEEASFLKGIRVPREKMPSTKIESPPLEN